jgi:ABC-type protease/lipase transport system fused ATPase/permease subunit
VRGTVLWLVAISAISSALGLASSLFVLHIYDRVLSTRSLFTLAFLTVVFGAMLLAAGVLDVLRGRILVRMANLVEHDSLTRAQLALFSRPARRTPDATVLDEARVARQALTSPAAGALFDVLWTPIFVLACFLIHPLVGLSVLACALVLAAVLVAGQRAGERIRDDLRDVETREAAFLRAVAGVLPTYWATGRERDLAAAWRSARGSAMRTFTAGADRSLTIAVGTRSLRGLVQILVLAVAAALAVRNEVSVGGIFAASLLAGRVLQPLEILASGWGMARDAWTALARLWRTAPDVAVSPPAASQPATATRLATGIQSLHAFAGPRPTLPPAIRDVTVAIAPGEILGIMGPVGSGKSTLLKLLAGMTPSTDGTVRLEGRDPWTAQGEGPRVGYLAQTPVFLPGTLGQNIAGFDAGADRTALTDAVTRAGLGGIVSRLPDAADTLLDEAGRPLSEGERQLAALARALYGRPSVLVLDTPESAAGPDGEAVVAQAIADTASAGGIVIVASHSTRLLRHATRIALLTDGRIMRVLPPTELLGVPREERREARSA